MGTPIVRSLDIFSEEGKMHLFRFLSKFHTAVTYIICVFQHKREGQDSDRVVTINSSIRGVLLRNSGKLNLVFGMPVPAHIKVEGDKISISCIWYRKTEKRLILSPLTI